MEQKHNHDMLLLLFAVHTEEKSWEDQTSIAKWCISKVIPEKKREKYSGLSDDEQNAQIISSEDNEPENKYYQDTSESARKINLHKIF